MQSASNPRRHPDTAFRQVGDEGGLVVLPTRAEVKVVNLVGATVFGLLDGEHSLEEITEAVRSAEDQNISGKIVLRCSPD